MKENKDKQVINLQEDKTPVGKTLLELQAEIRQANKLEYLKKLREQKRWK
jgi:hypothetical protein